VLPSHATTYHTCYGGFLINWIETVASVSVQRHTRQRCLLAGVDDIFFQHPVFVGELVTCQAIVTRVFNSSIEVLVEAMSEDRHSGTKRLCCVSYLTYVSVNEKSQMSPAAQAVVETTEEKVRAAQATQRREIRLEHKLNLLKQLITMKFQTEEVYAAQIRKHSKPESSSKK